MTQKQVDGLTDTVHAYRATILELQARIEELERLVRKSRFHLRDHADRAVVNLVGEIDATLAGEEWP